ncbi:MAG: tetraprenyl-beta-curcumene synthase family protein [Syntrophomonadaceae bacterium]|nr:tetraprenyl-beta-curcumene synthase family protein [Syntrophomonadaceae bacterium]
MLAILTRFVTRVFPKVEKELKRWQELIKTAGDAELRHQGLASIEKKKFHCLGGSVYTLMEGAHEETLPFIVAFQTISDYLDNLCDRAGCLDAAAFRQLHLAFTDALEPDKPLNDYYQLYPHKDDAGYLQALVEECRRIIKKLPSYHIVKESALNLALLYCDLQTYKHTHYQVREKQLKDWFARYAADHQDLYWWEFAAATGSTLGIFALIAAAGQPNLDCTEAAELTSSYFPWICGLHILLDYFIDQEEDILGGDLNFVSYYPDQEMCRQRMILFQNNALKCAAALPEPLFHVTVVKGLPAFYLSDPKVRDQGLDDIARELLEVGGGMKTLRMHRVCRSLRKRGII